MSEIIKPVGNFRGTNRIEKATNGAYKINFEPARHPEVLSSYNVSAESIMGSFVSGNPNTFFWNPEVGQRIGSYQPKLVTIDSSNVVLTPDNQRLWNTNEAVFTWLSLPAQPKDINPFGRVFSVATDQLVTDGPLEAAFKNVGGENDQLAKVLGQELSNGLFYDNYGNAITKFAIGGFGLLGSLAVGVPSGVRSMVTENPISRRRFLRMSAAAGVTAAVSGGVIVDGFVEKASHNDSTLLNIAAHAKTIEERERIVEQFDRSDAIERTPWVRARNALYALKTQGAYDVLQIDPSSPSAIVAGTAHLQGMSELLNNNELAAQTLRSYVGSLFQSIDEFFNNGGQHSLTREQAKQLIVDTVALTTIDTINQPDDMAFRQNPVQAVEEAITKGVPYKDPRTLQALAPLLQ